MQGQELTSFDDVAGKPPEDKPRLAAVQAAMDAATTALREREKSEPRFFQLPDAVASYADCKRSVVDIGDAAYAEYCHAVPAEALMDLFGLIERGGVMTRARQPSATSQDRKGRLLWPSIVFPAYQRGEGSPPCVQDGGPRDLQSNGWLAQDRPDSFVLSSITAQDRRARMKRTWTWTLLGAVCLLGCGEPPEDGAWDDASGDSEEFISQTIIRHLPGGAITQETTYITREEQLAQIAAREEYVRRLKSGEPQQLMGDLVVGGCAGASLWLFDKPNRQGRQLCLYKNPADSYAFIDLGKVVRYYASAPPILFTYYWSRAVASLWSGEDAGMLSTCDTVIMACYPDGPNMAFGTWQVHNTLTYFPEFPTRPGPNTVFLDN